MLAIEAKLIFRKPVISMLVNSRMKLSNICGYRSTVA